jgi:hypothetical protein
MGRRIGSTMFENLLLLLLVGACVFGLLWLLIEAAVKLGDLISNGRG